MHIRGVLVATTIASIGLLPRQIIASPPSYSLSLAAVSTQEAAASSSQTPNVVFISFPSNTVISTIPDGCVSVSITEVSCTASSGGTAKVLANFGTIVVADGTPPKLQSVVVNGETCPVSTACPAGGPNFPTFPQTTKPTKTTMKSTTITQATVTKPMTGETITGPPATSAVPASATPSPSSCASCDQSESAGPAAPTSAMDPTQNTQVKSKTSQTGLIVGIVLGVAILILLILLCVIQRRHRQQDAKEQVEIVASVDPHQQEADIERGETNGPSRIADSMNGAWSSMLGQKRKSPWSGFGRKTSTPRGTYSFGSSEPIAAEGTSSTSSRGYSLREDMQEKDYLAAAIAVAVGGPPKPSYVRRRSGDSLDPMTGDILYPKDALEEVRRERFTATAATIVDVPEVKTPKPMTVRKVQVQDQKEDDPLAWIHDHYHHQQDGYDQLSNGRVMQEITLGPSGTVMSTVAVVPPANDLSRSPSNAREKLYRVVSAASDRIRQIGGRRSMEEEQLRQHHLQQRQLYPQPLYDDKAEINEFDPISTLSSPSISLKSTTLSSTSSPRSRTASAKPIRSSRRIYQNTSNAIRTDQIQQLQRSLEDPSRHHISDMFAFVNPGTLPVTSTSTITQIYTLSITGEAPSYGSSGHSQSSQSLRHGFSRPIQIQRQEEPQDLHPAVSGQSRNIYGFM
ncbi:hypothetical protein BGZ83_007909 [Gryganskiella cystojenkinii]|nr:hypothetical protein BGZ83_007909 [Gryganskiella cystojenkinii]